MPKNVPAGGQGVRVMFEFIDYSSRRGAIVPLLPQVHSMIKELSEKDRLGGPPTPVALTTWKRKTGLSLLDVSRRFLFALRLDGARKEVLGMIFYRGEGSNLFIEDMHIAWKMRRNPAVLDGLIAKLQLDPRAQNAQFFGSERLKMVPDKEILAGVGFRDTFPDGWEPLGNSKEALGSLKQRYTRNKS